MRFSLFLGLIFFGFSTYSMAETGVDAQTLLNEAITNDDKTAVEAAIKAGASLTQRDFLGYQALHYAASIGSIDVIPSLLSAGADIQAQAKDGRLALTIAAAEGKLKAIETLLALGAQINAPGGYHTVYRAKNVTALMEAAANGQVEAVRYLLSKGANVNQLDSNKDPALNYAVYTGKYESSKELLAAGSIRSISGFGGTALDLAERQWKNNPELQTLLKDAGCKKTSEIKKSTPAEMLKNISWYAGSYLKIAVNGKTIHIDPNFVMTKENADILLYTHDHDDHYNPQSADKLGNPPVKLAPFDFPGSERIAPFQSKLIDDILIQAVPAYNPDNNYHPKSKGWVGYIITIDGVSIYVMGDTDRIPELKQVKADLLFIPLVRPFTMKSLEVAVAASKDTGAKLVVPIHWGNDRISSDAKKFLALAAKEGIEAVILPAQ